MYYNISLKRNYRPDSQQEVSQPANNYWVDFNLISFNNINVMFEQNIGFVFVFGKSRLIFGLDVNLILHWYQVDIFFYQRYISTNIKTMFSLNINPKFSSTNTKPISCHNITLILKKDIKLMSPNELFIGWTRVLSSIEVSVC